MYSEVNQLCVYSPSCFSCLLYGPLHCYGTATCLDFLGYSECLACQKPVISPKPLTGLETPAVEIPASSLALPLKNDAEIDLDLWFGTLDPFG